MAFLSQAPRLEGVLPSHGAFQGHAAHLMGWSMKLRPNGSRGTCIPRGLSTCLHAACTAHQSHAITTAAPLFCPRNSTSHPTLTVGRDTGPTRRCDRTQPPRALGRGAARPPALRAGGQAPFFEFFHDRGGADV